MKADARSLAWELLQRVDGGSFADAVLGQTLAASHLDRREQALLTRILYGTLAWRGFLQSAIACFAGRPATAIEAPVRLLLEIGIYQLFFLDRVPDYAVVDASVELAKRHKQGRAAGLVNAILRRAAREGRDAVVLPDADRDPAGYLAARYSHPRWLVERWLGQLGRVEAEALLAADNEISPTSLRVNSLRRSREEVLSALAAAEVAAQPSAVAPGGIRLAGGPLENLPGLAEGFLSLQGEASQLVGLLVAPQEGELVVDACAGAGGKSTHLAEQCDRCVVVALDRSRSALVRAAQEARRLGLQSIRPVAGDAAAPPLRRHADRVLLDAPCTGLGTLRQHPEIRWRRTAADIASNSMRQRRLLSSSAEAVRAGGVLVYATCSPLAEENEHVVEAVRAARGDLEIEDARTVLPASAHSLVGEDGALRTWPHRHGLDGFFAVRLKRR